MYAVFRTGGKQYRVVPGQQVRVDRLPGEAGDIVELGEVLMFSSEAGLAVGTPSVENARVVASIVEQSRGRKINVFKYKSKIRYRKLRGHKQLHTDLRIEELVGPDGTSYKHEKKERIVEEAVVEEDEAATDELVTEDEVEADEESAEEETSEEPSASVDDDEADDESDDDSADADDADEEEES